MREHNINDISCKQRLHYFKTKSNLYYPNPKPNTNSLFLDLLLFLAIFILHFWTTRYDKSEVSANNSACAVRNESVKCVLSLQPSEATAIN